MGFKNYLNAYEFECELPGSGEKIKYKPITTNQVKSLLVYENETNPIVIEEAFDDLIKSCVITEGFDINELLLQDRYFILIQLRKVSKGEQFEFQFTCPECGSDNLTHIDFNKFKITKRADKIENKIKIADEIFLYIDHITRGKQKEAYKNIDKSLAANMLQAEMAFNSIAMSIIGIETPDGIETDLTTEDKFHIMDNISFNIFDDIKKWYEVNDFGIDLTYKYGCVHCNWVSEDEKLEITSNFF